MLTPSNDSTKAGLLKLAELYRMPDFVKQADMNELSDEEIKGLPTSAFADAIYRQYPCHTKAATWVSIGYALANYDNIPEYKRNSLFNNLEKKAEYFDMLPEYTQLLEQTTMQEKQAAPVKEAAGYLRNDAEIEKAADWLVQQKNKLPLYKRAETADLILKQADAINLRLENREALERMVGKGFSEFDDVMGALRARTTFSKKASYVAEMNHYLDRVAQMKPDPFNPVWYKVACVVDDFDYLSGLMPMRERGELAAPEDLIFADSATTVKKAEEATVRLVNGDVYEMEKLANVSREDYDRLLGEDLTEQLFAFNVFDKTAAADILPTLPRTDADAFKELMNTIEVAPVTRLKAAGYSLPEALIQDAMNYYF